MADREQSIKVYWQKNPLVKTADGKDSYRARTKPSPIGEKEWIDRMMLKNTGLARSTIEAVLSVADESLDELVKEDHSLSCRFGIYWPGAKATTDNPSVSFNSLAHQKTLQITRPYAKRNLLDGIPYQQIDPPNLPVPLLQVLLDLSTKAQNSQLSPGHSAKLNGSHLQFEEQSAEQGVFFINSTDKSEVRAEEYISISQGEISFLIPPDLPAATYKLELRGPYYSGLLGYDLSVS